MRIPKSIAAFLERQEKAGRKFEKFQPRPYQWLSEQKPPAMDDFTDAAGAYEAAHRLTHLYGRMEVLAFEEGEVIPTHLVGLHGEGVLEPDIEGAAIGEALRDLYKKYDSIGGEVPEREKNIVIGDAFQNVLAMTSHLEDDDGNKDSMEEDESDTEKSD